MVTVYVHDEWQASHYEEPGSISGQFMCDF